MAQRDVTDQADWSAGSVRDTSPENIPDDGAFEVLNGLLDEDSSVYRRGGATFQTNAWQSSEGLRFGWEGYFELVGERRFLVADANQFAVLDNDLKEIIPLGGPGLAEPPRCAELSGYLFIGGGYIYAGATSPSGTGTFQNVNDEWQSVGGSSDVQAGHIFEEAGGVYVVTESTNNGRAIKIHPQPSPNNQITINGSAIYEIQGIDQDGICKSAGYETIANRMCGFDETKVRFSELDLDSMTVANPLKWTDTDFHEIPQGAIVEALVAVGDVLIVLSTAGIWTIRGLALNIVDPNTGTPQHAIDVLSRDLIIHSPQGVATWEQVAIVPCLDGIWLLDGISTPVQLSGWIDKSYAKFVYGRVIGQAAVFKNHYFLPVITGDEAAYNCMVCRVDRAIVQDRRRRARYPWTLFRGLGSSSAAFVVRNELGTTDLYSCCPDQVSVLNPDAGVPIIGAAVLKCSSFFTPDATNAFDPDGSMHPFHITTRDYETGDLTLNVIRKLRLAYEMVSDEPSLEPRIRLDIGQGGQVALPAMWGDPAGEWGVGFGPAGDSPWMAYTEAEFEPVMRENLPEYAPTSDGVDPFDFWVNKRRRFGRYRIALDNAPPSYLVVHRVEQHVRRAGTARR